MKYKLGLLLTILNLICFAQNKEFTDSEITKISRVYGFFCGQDLGLNKVKAKYPELLNDVSIAELKFNLAFGEERIRIKNDLESLLGQEKLTLLNNSLLNKLGGILSNELSKAEALEFIKLVLSRSNGDNIPSPVFETILAYKYKGSPEREFLDGFTYSFHTKGHEKAKGTDWQIRLPKSWIQSEADRPSIIQKFQSQFNEHNASIMLLIKNLDQLQKKSVSKDDILAIFENKSFWGGLEQEGMKIISTKKMIIDNQPGGYLEAEQTIERLDYKARVRMAAYAFYRKNQMYILQGMVFSLDNSENLEKILDQYRILFKLVANSVVVNDQYK
ncbi:MAG: hypothetical protein K9I84_03620 [Leadbetterella sp.]|nr:hypothetical protein [Leadbetterella sp.]